MSASSNNMPSPCNDNAQAQQTQQDHDARGRWVRGNKGGPGSPFNRRVAALRRLLLQQVSAADLAAIVAKIVEKAKQGDLAAAKLVMAYTVGKPTSAVDPDRVDVEEFNLLCEEAVPAETLTVPLAGIPASLACEIMTAALPQVTAAKAEQVRDALLADDRDEPEDECRDAVEAADNNPRQPAASKGPRRQAAPRPRQTKVSRQAEEEQAGEELQSTAELELPSVEQLQRHYRSVQAAVRGSADPATVSKRPVTASRAANPDGSAHTAPQSDGSPL